jgi:hypothetical protein
MFKVEAGKWGLAILAILGCHYQIGLGPPTTDDTRPNGLNHVLLLLSSIDDSMTMTQNLKMMLV